MTDNAKNYHEKMFPGYVSDFLRTDPEFIEAFDNFLRYLSFYFPPNPLSNCCLHPST